MLGGTTCWEDMLGGPASPYVEEVALAWVESDGEDVGGWRCASRRWTEASVRGSKVTQSTHARVQFVHLGSSSSQRIFLVRHRVQAWLRRFLLAGGWEASMAAPWDI